MAVLKWGKPSLFQKAPVGTPLNATEGWTDIATPKEGTMQMSTNDGQETTAVEEGGEIVDVRYGKSTTQLEWEEFDKDEDYAFEDEDGLVKEDTAIRWLPEDDTKSGFYFPQSKVRVSNTFNVTDGSMRKYTVRAFKPKNGGRSVQRFSKSDLTSA